MENEKINLLFVCLGNICRSPAAEGIMKKMVDDQGLSNKIFIDSAGTSNWHEGSLPDDRMRKHGSKRGYYFTSYARPFKSSDFTQFDYILVMDRNNYNNVKRLAKSDEDVAKIHYMTEFSSKFADHDHVPDPYYGGDDGFNLVMDLLEDACTGLLNEIKAKL